MQNGWCYVKITNSLPPRHVLQIGILQIREYEMETILKGYMVYEVQKL